MTKICIKCKRELPMTIEHFRIAKNCKDGYTGECKQCISERKKQYRQENKEYYAERSRQYYKDNKEVALEYNRQYLKLYNIETNYKRQKKYQKKNKEKYKQYALNRLAREKEINSTLTVEQWIYIKNYFNNSCAYCGKEVNLTHEHIIPIIKNGEYSKINIIPACGSCNSRKNTKSFEEWYSKQEFYSKVREQKILNILFDI